MAEKFTKTKLDKLKAPTKSGKQEFHWDTQQRGLGLCVSGTSDTKSFVCQWKLRGKTQRKTLGQWPAMDLKQAREAAQELIYEKKRQDPKGDRLTLGQAMELYIKDHRNLRPRSVDTIRQTVEQYLSDWKDTPFKHIDSHMVKERYERVQQDVEARQRKRGATGHASANKVLRTIRGLWNHAAKNFAGIRRDDNPMRLTASEMFKVEPRENIIPKDRFPDFYEAVKALNNPVQRDCVLLALFTGLRSGEVRALRWSEVDLKEKLIRIPKERVKAGRKLDLPMSDYIYSLLKKRSDDFGQGRWVFPANSKSGHIEELKFPLGQVDKATGIRVSVHDLRRTFITVAKSARIPLEDIKAIVNHSRGGDVTLGYTIDGAEDIRWAMQKITDELKRLCGLTKKGKLVELPVERRA